MRENISFSEKEVVIIIFLSMLFSICESLSIELNNFFRNYTVFQYQLSFNVSVIFFCVGFFIIDLITELYNEKVANYFIYTKIITQLAFVGFGILGVKLSGIKTGQIAKTFIVAPHILVNAIIASIFGYKITGKIMRYLKIKFNGRFLFTRYLSSTFPGEVVFSFVFTLLCFSQGRTFLQTINVFIGLVIIKFILSAIFSVLIIPITNLLKFYFKIDASDCAISSVPFIKNGDLRSKPGDLC